MYTSDPNPQLILLRKECYTVLLEEGVQTEKKQILYLFFLKYLTLTIIVNNCATEQTHFTKFIGYELK